MQLCHLYTIYIKQRINCAIPSTILNCQPRHPVSTQKKTEKKLIMLSSIFEIKLRYILCNNISSTQLIKIALNCKIKFNLTYIDAYN